MGSRQGLAAKAGPVGLWLRSPVPLSRWPAPAARQARAPL